MATRRMQRAPADLEVTIVSEQAEWRTPTSSGHRRAVQLRLCQTAHLLTLVQSGTSSVLTPFATEPDTADNAKVQVTNANGVDSESPASMLVLLSDAQADHPERQPPTPLHPG